MNKTFTLLEISNAVCNYYGITEKTLLKNDRNKHPIIRKQLFFYFSREFTNESYPSIGKYSGYNHANVIHSVNKILIEREIYPDIKKDIKEITEMLFKSIVVQDIDLLKLTENYSKLFN